ncbi:MAG TPA: carboxypeptidase regulatory-like domain-containing protein [Polyangiaceae bacterium]|nr:carboxypeptidase regulatory-like domain-containing protein [Polyangiaceae bacterium]
MARYASTICLIAIGAVSGLEACGGGSTTFEGHPSGGQGGGSTGGSMGVGGIITISDASGGTGGTGGIIGTDGAVAPRPCQNLECYQNKCTLGQCKAMPCSAGGTTSLSGSIYDPAGKIPLYNVIVYVPNAPVDPIVNGATCDRCGGISGSPIASAITDAKGQFVLRDVPVTANVPLVIQVGKWRRQVTVPMVTSCADTALADKDMMRLPRSAAEGDLPKMALATGGADALECLLRKIGVADSEFTPESAAGHVNFYSAYQGTSKYKTTVNGGAPFTPAPTLWDNLANLKKYDVVLLSCEGDENSSTAKNKSPAALQAMQDYLNTGGRVFASHWHEFWVEKGPPPFPTVATFNHQKDLADPFTADIDMSFPKGQALADWLVNVGGKSPKGKIAIKAAQHTIDAVNSMVGQRWIYSTTPTSVQYLTANTPMNVPEDKQCGRVVLSDIHVSSGDTPNASTGYPDGCKTTELSDQEKALEFMLFDLSSCVIGDSKPPVPPIVK